MEKLNSSLKNMVVVLLSTAVLMGGILAVVNRITAAPIEQQKQKQLAEGIQAVMGGGQINVEKRDTLRVDVDKDGKEETYVVHSTADKDGKQLGAAVESATQGFGGPLKILVGFNNDGNILGYAVLETTETPGLGAKADTWFQKGGKGNIIGKNPKKNKMGVTKGGEGEVDAITASTITSRAFLKAVNNAYHAWTGQLTDRQSVDAKMKKQ